jgi:3-oxoacyl-[acyl-carrier protein] reductase
MTKSGVVSLTRSWAPQIRAQDAGECDCTGATDTPMLEIESASPETLPKESMDPLGRVGRPEEIAAAAVFLVSPGATFMTGQYVSPYGGAAMF